MIRRRHVLPSVSLAEISPEVAKLSRRRLLRNGLSLGSLALLTGCDLSTHSGIDAALWAMLRFDDRVQSALYNPQRLPKPIRRARSPDRSASTLTIQFGRSARSQKIGALPSPGWLQTRPRGRSTDCAACRSKLRSPGTSVSKDGARSGSGAVCRCTSFCAASARICGRVMSPSPALTAIRPV